MCKASVKEHVGQELIHMEVASQEKVKTEHGVEVDTAALKYPRCQKCQYINDKQILRHGWYAVHLAILSFAN